MAFIDDNDGDDMDLGFDVGDIAPKTYELLPKMVVGFNVGKIEISTFGDKPGNTAKNTGKQASIELIVTTEGYVGRRIFDRIMVSVQSKSQDEESVKKAADLELSGKQKIAALFASCGVNGRNLAALAERSGRAKIGVEEEKNGFDAKNVVKAYLFDKPAEGSAAAGPPKAAAPAAAPGEPAKRQPPKFAK